MDLFKAIEGIVDAGQTAYTVGKTFLVGTGSDPTDESGNIPDDEGFLGSLGSISSLIKKGAGAYTAMQGADKDDPNPFAMQEQEGYTAKRGYRQQQASLSTQRYTPTNRMYQDAILRRMRQVNFDKNLQRMTESTTVRPTSRRGSPVSAGTTTITRQTGAPSARPAKTTKTA